MPRPRLEIDRNEFEKLCVLQCTKEDIAQWFECSEDTIERWVKREYKKRYAEVFAEKRQKGKVSLRRMQWQAAERGNVSMLIWLGKQYLGQSDSVINETTISADDGFIKALKESAGSDWDDTESV